MAKHKHHKFTQTVIVIMILNMLEPGVAHLCSDLTEMGLRGALCNQKGFKSIPNDLDPMIEILSMVNNPMAEIKRSDMMRYKNLKSFKHALEVSLASGVMRSYLKIESNAFVDLHQLKILQITASNLSPTSFIILPTTIDTLYLNYAHLKSTTIDLSKLENLKMALLSFNNLTVMPRFHKYAPLERVWISDNPIDITPVAQMVRYCKLTQWEIQFEYQGKITTSGRDKCECRRLQEWTRRKKILTQYGPHLHVCPTREPPCTEELIPPEWEQLYDDCVHNRRDPSHDLKDELPPLPVNPNTESSSELGNVTPDTVKKPIPKIVYFFMLMLALVTLLTAICFYLIFHKKRPTESMDYQEQGLEEGEEEGDELN